MMVDFKEFTLTKGEIFCILPGQVHQGLHASSIKACGVAAVASAVPQHVRTFFEQSILQINPVLPLKDEQRAIKMALDLLMELNSKETKDRQSIQVHAINAAMAVLANLFTQVYERFTSNTIAPPGRDRVITQAFRHLLKQHFREHRPPAFYAAHLHISPPYLNQAIRRMTGMPVSHWIQAEIVMEAKRMLFHTNLTSKEIAFELGFEDHTYFTRFFTKKAGQTPLAFRTNSRQ